MTHTLVGAVFGKTGLEKVTPLATPALLVAVNLPDIDIVAPLFGRNYIEVHRGITHSLPGVAMLSVLLAAGCWLWSRSRDPVRCVRFMPILGICFVGALSNPALDMLNDYGSRPWLPFSEKRFYGDLLPIVDFWIWLVLAAALFVPPSARRGRVMLGAAGVAGAALVLLAGGWIQLGAWLCVFALALAGSRMLRSRGVNTARVALAVVVVYLAGLYLQRATVAAAAAEWVPRLVAGRVEQIDVVPAGPGLSGRWTVIAQTPLDYRVADVRSGDWASRPPVFEIFQKNLRDPAYRRALDDSRMAAMARVSRFPCVRVTRAQNRCTVFLSDVRLARRGQGIGATAVEVPRCGEVPATR